MTRAPGRRQARPGGKSFYEPALDGLRFFAFFLVFLHHAPWTPLVSPPFPDPWFFLVRLRQCGWMGVDLFLCLSSYLITRLLWMEWRKKGKISVPRFYLRRILRIWPLYFLACFLGFYLLPRLKLDAPAWGSPEYGAFLHSYLLPHLAFFANIAIALHGVVTSFSLVPLWTISLEEQFYLLCPLLLALARFDRRKILWAGAGLLVLAAAARFFFISHGWGYPAVWVSLPTRLDPFVLGCLLALFQEDLDSLAGKTPAWVLTATGLGCLLGAMAMPDMEQGGMAVVGQFGLLDLGWAFLLFSACRPGWLKKAVTRAPFPLWGKISYGLYVYHMVALHQVGMALTGFLAGAGLRFSDWSVCWAITGASLLLTFALAFLSYYFYEKPFLKLKEKFAFIKSRAA